MNPSAQLRLLGDGRAHERRPDLLQHLVFRALDDGDERKHVLLLRRRSVGRVAVQDGREQVVGAPCLTTRGTSRCRAVTSVTPGVCRSASIACEMASATPGTVNAARLASGSSGGSGRIAASRSATALGDLARMAAGPDAGAIDAAAPAVEEHAVDHHVEERLPVVDLVVADHDLREAGAVRLDAGIAAIAIDRRGARRRSGCGRSCRAPPRRRRPVPDRRRSPRAECRPERRLRPSGTASTAPAVRA